MKRKRNTNNNNIDGSHFSLNRWWPALGQWPGRFESMNSSHLLPIHHTSPKAAERPINASSPWAMCVRRPKESHRNAEMWINQYSQSGATPPSVLVHLHLNYFNSKQNIKRPRYVSFTVSTSIVDAIHLKLATK